MKQLIPLAIILFFICEVKAQSSIALGFNSTGAGRGIICQYNHKKNKNEFGIGMRFNLNYPHNLDNQSKLHYKRLHALKPIQHLGIVVSYHRYILPKLQTTSFFSFYDVQATYAMAKSYQFRMSDADSISILYTNPRRNLGPFVWIEQNIGIGHRLKLSERMYLIQKIGIGTFFVIGREKTAVIDNVITPHYFKRFSWEFGYLFNMGIGYNF